MFPRLDLVGGASERGRAYGRAAAGLIRHSLASYSRLFAYRRGIAWHVAQAEAEAYRDLIGDLAPDLLAEIEATAEGANLQRADILALNVRTELLAGIAAGVHHPAHQAALAHNRSAGLPEHGECTTVAAQPAMANGTTLLAQTWDWSGDQRAACVLLHISDGKQRDLLTISEAGMAAKIGVNRAGIAVSLNLLRSRDDGQRIGMPVHILLRLMLEAESFAEARALAARLPAAGSSCITIASAQGELVSLEITPRGVAEIWPEGGLLAHTNHCLDADAALGECPLDPVSTSVARVDRARELLHAANGDISVATLQAILRDHGGEPNCICRHPNTQLHPVDRGESVLGAVIEPASGTIHIAPDIPCQVPFSPVHL